MKEKKERLERGEDRKEEKVQKERIKKKEGKSRDLSPYFRYLFRLKRYNRQ